MRCKAKHLLTAVSAGGLSMLSTLSIAEQPAKSIYNMTEGVSRNSEIAFDLHMLMFWACVAIGIVVFGVMFYAMIFHRKSRGAKASNFHESTALEIMWTIVPFVILILMAVPATSGLKEMYNTDDSDMEIVVTGYQWKWKYEYLGEDVSFFSSLSTPREQINNEAPKGEHYLLEVDEPLVLPTNHKVKFIVSSNDVIHSWWVPDLGVKRDAVPGYSRDAWTETDQPGTYRGVCAELCGKDHGFMPIVVVVKPEAEYKVWLAEKKRKAAIIKELTKKKFTFDELYANGEQVYNKNCMSCHGAKGEGGVGKAIAGSAIAMGPIEQHIDIIVNGSANNAMMGAFGEQLSEADIAAVITYQRNAFGNNMGDELQPIDILNFKEK